MGLCRKSAGPLSAREEIDFCRIVNPGATGAAQHGTAAPDRPCSTLGTQRNVTAPAAPAALAALAARARDRRHPQSRMPTLFHHPFCPHSRFVRLALGEYGLSTQAVEERAWERRPEFLILNPACTTPISVFPSMNMVCWVMNSG